MKTAKRIIPLILVLILLLALGACGAAKSSQSASDTATTNESVAVAPESQAADKTYSDISSGTGVQSPQDTGESTTEVPSSGKIIYSGYSEIETLDFDKSNDDLLKMVSETGGFIQSSNVTGGNYNAMYSGKEIYRYADYTIRIPADKFKSVIDSLKSIGNVVSSSTNAENITMQYTDTESRLATCRTKEARLLELLSKATSMEDILAIENSLSDVRYEIESLTSQIKNWDSLINYSTMTISLREVALYSKDTNSTISYGQQLKEAFVHSLYAIGHFFKGFFKFLVGAFPVLVVLAIIAVPVLLIVKSVRKKKTNKMSNDSYPPQDK